MSRLVKIRFYRSATVGIISDAGTRILCDPWLTDGAYIGSWHHWPRLEGDEFERVLSERWDAVYVSHLHPDHFDRKFIAALGRLQPHCRFILPALATPWLRRAVENCGIASTNISEGMSERPLAVGDIHVTVVRADHCDPSICGVATPCHEAEPRLTSIDSLAIFQADGQTILNANDSLAVASVWRALSLVGKVDVLLGHFGGAGPYPQCFPSIPRGARQDEASRKASEFVARLATAAMTVGARFVLPFAGQYVLGGRLVGLNDYRSVWPLERVSAFLQENTNSEVVTLAPFAYFSVSSGEVEHQWMEPSEEDWFNYSTDLKSVVFPYERRSDHLWDFERAAQDAFPRVRIAFEGSRQYSSATADCALILEMVDLGEIAMQFSGQRCSLVNSSRVDSSNVTRIVGDSRLWRRLIVRRPGYKGFTPYHFNQAEIGSHFEWYRQGPYRDEIRFLNFLQTR